VEVMWFNFKPSMLIQRPMSFQAEPGLRKWSGFNLNPSMSIQWLMSSLTEPSYILKWRWELLEPGIEGVAWGQSRGQWWRRGAGLAQHTGRQKGCRRQGRWVSGWHRDEQRYDWKEDCQFVTEATDLHPRIQHQRNWTHNIIISTNFIKFTRRIVDWVWELADYYMWVFMILWRTRPHLGNRYIYKSECVTWSYNLVGVHFTKNFNQ
jgi:hypothetical protein